MLRRGIIAAAAVISCLASMAVTPTIVRNTDTKACERWVDSVYNSLTMKQRIAQLVFPKIVPTLGDESKEKIDELVGTDGVGGLIFTHGSIDDYVTMTNYAQEVAKVPVLMTFDGEWGLSMRIPGTPRFPKNMGLGAIDDTSLLYRYGKEMARECKAMGIHVNFAPVADVNSNPDNPVIGHRSFGEDPMRVARAVTAYSQGLEAGGVQAVAKHFPGHGDTDTDSHKVRTVVNHSAKTLGQIDLVPFAHYITGGCSGIMMGHIVVPSMDRSGVPASMSAKLTEDVLRRQMGFEGLIYTDALSMKGADMPTNNSVIALNAGADVLLSSMNAAVDIDELYKAYEEGRVSEQTIEDRCKRVLTYKYALGLNNIQPIEREGLEQVLNTPEADALNRELAAAMMTVVFNRNNVLPIGNLDKNAVAVVCFGDDEGGEFVRTCRRYADVDVFEVGTDKPLTKAEIEKIGKYGTVVAAIFDDSQEMRAQMSRLDGMRCVVDVFMVNPYRMQKFHSSIKHAKALVIAYDNTPYTREYAAQAIFGGIDVMGTLPVDVHDVAKIGAGVQLKKTRLGYTSPLQEGMNPNLTTRLDSLMANAMELGAVYGAQVLVAKDGNVVHNKCYGHTDNHGTKVTEATVYDLASVSKALGTLPGVMKAYDLGLVDLDERIVRYIPQITDSAKQDITVRELLFHESGMPASMNMFVTMMDTTTYEKPLIVKTPDAQHTVKIQRGAYGYDGARLRTDITSDHRTSRHNIEADRGIYVGRETYDTIMRRIYDIPLRNSKRYNYSCLNFCLLMDIEQRTTGIDHQTWASDSIWAPLGAWSICYRPTEHHELRNIAPTEIDTYLRKQHVHGFVHDELANFSGGVQGNAGLFANANDLAKICQMWLNGGEYGDKRILSQPTVKLFTTERSATCRRGLGFDKPDPNPDNSPTCEEAPLTVFGHTGFTGTVFWVDPTNNLIFIFLSNRVNPTRDNDAFASMSLRGDLFSEVYKSLVK